ncbi:hypothetical protein E2320_000696 [Naja naja]|nr:hypothetical protein E2320_000696 [Naja naja]
MNLGEGAFTVLLWQVTVKKVPLCSYIFSKAMMEAPVCLIENGPNGFHASPEALRLLSDIRQPVVVVSIVGQYRTGKSYLMNRLAGKNSGLIASPVLPESAILTQESHANLGYFVVELSEHIKVKASSTPGDMDDSSEFVGFFPKFMWTVRDFTLQLERDGQPITEDKYLEHALKFKKGNTKEDHIFNLPRKCIRQFFPERKCFVFECPAQRKKLPHLEQMEDSELDPEFVEHNIVKDKLEEFCSTNELKSSEICSVLLSSLSETLEKNIKDGSYIRAGGHQEFLNELQKVEEQFLERPKKGIMAEKILKEFLQSKENISKTILQSDVSLQEKEKEIEDEKRKAKDKELEHKVQKQEMERLQQKLEDQKRTNEMNYEKLKEKLEEERNRIKEENEKMIQSKCRKLCKDRFPFGLHCASKNERNLDVVFLIRQANQTLVLLDTEGLGDVEKAKASSSPEDTDDSSEFVGFFPTFVWSVRDFALQLERDGQPITEDEYLEHALELKKGNGKKKQMYNLPRKCIRLFFPTRKCFVFDCPTKSRNLPYLEKMADNQLEPEFVEQAKKFCFYIFATSQEKTLRGGHIVTGNCDGKVPCLENTVLALADIENRAAVQEAVACYTKMMERSLKLPTDSLQELLDQHKICEEQALQVFMARAFKDDKRQFQIELMKTVESKKEEYCQKNKEISSEICSALLVSLSEGLEENIKNGSYARAGGHQEFLNDLQKVEKQFFETPKKGIMAWRILKVFHRGKESISKVILQNDVTLQMKEKEIADEKMKAKAKELEKEAQKREKEMLKQKLEDHRQSHDMNLQKLKEKMVEEKKQMLEEYEKMIKSKLREEKALLEEGFEKEASQLNEKIEELRKQKEEMEKPSWITSALENLRTAIRQKLAFIHDEVVEPVVDRFKNLIQNITSKA